MSSMSYVNHHGNLDGRNDIEGKEKEGTAEATNQEEIWTWETAIVNKRGGTRQRGSGRTEA